MRGFLRVASVVVSTIGKRMYAGIGRGDETTRAGAKRVECCEPLEGGAFASVWMACVLQATLLHVVCFPL